MADVIGRLAPSPTGALHLGNARSFLLAWLSARQQYGKLLLRIEDIDSPRVKPWAREQTLADLRWLGLDWDWGPDVKGPHASYIQTERWQRYRSVLEQLASDGAIYPCSCSRREVTEAASAPHESSASPLQLLEGNVYPGTCRSKQPNEEAGEFAWRWCFDSGESSWIDAVLGKQTANPESQLGDFVIGKSDGTPAYQLAVVVDDFDMGVTEIVRGSDLVPSTYRQLAILKHLGWPLPTYCHVPLMVGPDGRRLAKRHGDTRLSYFRELGFQPQVLVGYLAWTLGLQQRPEALEPDALIGTLDWQKISAAPTVFCLEEFLNSFARG